MLLLHLTGCRRAAVGEQPHAWLGQALLGRVGGGVEPDVSPHPMRRPEGAQLQQILRRNTTAPPKLLGGREAAPRAGTLPTAAGAAAAAGAGM